MGNRGFKGRLKEEMGPSVPALQDNSSALPIGTGEEAESIINAVEQRIKDEAARTGQVLTEREAFLIRLAADSVLEIIEQREPTNLQGET